MKTKIISFLIILSCSSLSLLQCSIVSLDIEPIAICLGTIAFPHSVIPHANIYYNGKKLPIDIDTKEKRVNIIPYCLEESKSNQQFHMIICSECKIASKENTIQYLHVPKSVPYKFYTLSAARQYNKEQEVDGYLWNVHEDTLVHNIIPDNTIIFLFNANLIEGLHVKSWPQNSNIRILPEIVIKKSVSKNDISDAMNSAALASMDLDAIHKRNITSIKQINQKAVLSLKS